MTPQLTLDLVTQEKRLFTIPVSSVTAQTVEGEITILPGHVPLLTRLTEGILRFTAGAGEQVFAIFGGFLEVGSDNQVNVLADSAVRAEDIDLAKVESAKKQAEATLLDKSRELEFADAEAALRRAYLSIRAAQKSSK